MNEEKTVITKDVEKIENSKKDEFDEVLKKIKKMSEAIELHSNVKDAVSKQEVDNSYLNYIDNSIEDKIFDDARFDKIKSKVLLEVVCPEIANIEKFDIEKLEIKDIGNHFEGQNNYIDKICTYDFKFVCLFGVNERNSEDVIKYEKRKFTRQDMIDAICKKIETGKKASLDQYDEYYIVTDENGFKVYSERKMVALTKIEETLFDKIKAKISTFLHTPLFSKKANMPNVELLFESNPNRLKNIETNSKIEAKRRMKALLSKEREIARATNE